MNKKSVHTLKVQAVVYSFSMHLKINKLMFRVRILNLETSSSSSSCPTSTCFISSSTTSNPPQTLF